MHTLLNPVAMHTSDGEASADKGIIMWPFGEIMDVDVECITKFPVATVARKALPRGEY